jgi:predicted SAM-dependent methyltransferase
MNREQIKQLPGFREAMVLRRDRLARRERERVGRLRARTVAEIGKFEKLHLGSGSRQIPGWANLDLEGEDNLLWDLREPLPLPAGSIAFVYSEHFIEHVPRADGLRLLREARRVMKPGAVIRLSTPDMRVLAENYLSGKQVEMEHGGWFPASPCQMINEAMRLWGHSFIYDEPELRALLGEAGFRDIERVAWSQSEHAELRGLETRPDFGDLILEARA